MAGEVTGRPSSGPVYIEEPPFSRWLFGSSAAAWIWLVASRASPGRNQESNGVLSSQSWPSFQESVISMMPPQTALRPISNSSSTSAIRVPFLNVAATTDTIAPRTTTEATLAKVASRDKSEIVIAGGHVGIVVGRTAKTELWPRVSRWLEKHD